MQHIHLAAYIDLGSGKGLTTCKDILWKKIMTQDRGLAKQMLERNPQAELVNEYSAILGDESIAVIVIPRESPGCMLMVGQALREGKPVRLI